ncbi:arrestin domain-containing protein 17-like [Leptopilina heterotoma]|uniref:arrestin domain-containing protein 17-like n=1 Tax=Leptopilina heterotoma TaxID=63436 RepID=UPI001CA7D931|nr:arrestin domain-containing protein 17-like [Leptopilina heterotoma]
MGVKNFKIIFENPVKTYFPNDIVKGHVFLTLDGPKKCRGLRIKGTGEAKTSWSTSAGKGQTRYTGHEEYFSKRQYLIGGEYDDIELPHGESFFPFEFTLPSRLPSSFESKLGYIRYTIKATIDLPWKFDIETKSAFTVISKYDLNTDSNASSPVVESRTRNFGCFSSSPPLTATLSMPVKGYVPGQVIPININIKNLSRVTIYHVRLKLIKKVTFKVTKPRTQKRKKYMTIKDIHEGKIETNNVSFDEFIEVPSLPPSTLNECGLIDVQYAIELKLYIDQLCTPNLKFTSPVLIGTVPLNNCLFFTSVLSSLTQSSTAPSTPSAPPDYSTVINFELPPPTYQESIFAAENLQDDDDSQHVMGINDHFAPRYPVYKFPSR